MSFCSGGNADADTVLRLFDASCNLISVNDDACGGGRSEIVWDAWTDGLMRLQIANAVLTYPNPTQYDLCVRDLGAACDSCSAPNPTTLVPTPDCQFVSGSTGPTVACNTDYYLVLLEAGVTYRFSLCPSPAPNPPAPTCPGDVAQAAPACNPAADWNPRIEMWPAGSDCAVGAELTPGAIGSGGCTASPALPDFTLTAMASGPVVLAIGKENPAGNPAGCGNYGTYTLAFQQL